MPDAITAMDDRDSTRYDRLPQRVGKPHTTVLRRCLLCGDPIPSTSPRNRVTCSKKCRARLYRLHLRSRAQS